MSDLFTFRVMAWPIITDEPSAGTQPQLAPPTPTVLQLLLVPKFPAALEYKIEDEIVLVPAGLPAMAVVTPLRVTSIDCASTTFVFVGVAVISYVNQK